MSVCAINMAYKVLVEMERSCVNLFRLVYVESFRRRSLAPIRYVARAAHQVYVTYLVG
jgi:hypothetical protein